MEVRGIEYGSDEYSAARELREEVLRRPLGLTLSPSDLAGEDEQWHFGGFERGELVACVIAAPQGGQQAKLRQMAVDPRWRGTGCGRGLLEVVERELAQRGIRKILLHARLDAVGFYERLGYTKWGEEFQEISLPHVAMRKELAG